MTEPAAVRHSALEYRPAIDGLRALAVLSVFIFHLKRNWLPGGFVGVDVFFVISGFLITSIIYKECQTGSLSLARFYQRRIARIFPAFFTVAFGTLAVASFIYSPQDLASAGANLVAAALSVANMKLMMQGNYFALSPDAQPFLHYWSLSVEEQFYIFFPLFLFLLFKYARRFLVPTLAVLCAGSFVFCLVMMRLKPAWAFYLLPTRAWELLAGCLLAVTSRSVTASWQKLISVLSLGLVALSFVLVREGQYFPGYWALLPVIGAVGLLGFGQGGPAEKWLAAAPLVAIGRISYSLYLWHWPVFSLIDYRMYLSSDLTRMVLKVVLSFAGALVSYWLIENPARQFLNQRKNILIAYAFMVGVVVVCIPIGSRVRSANFVNAQAVDVRDGGLIFDSKTSKYTVMLMGDSNGSMYGKVTRSICKELGCKLSVISVVAGDPLPAADGATKQLWLDSLEAVRKEKPDCLVLACRWDAKLAGGKERLATAVEALRPLVGRLVILNQPPLLPERATRGAIRSGARPPFYEDAELRRHRTEANDYLLSFNSGNCTVIDIASHFQKDDGEVLFLDERGRQLYHDAAHLSGYGADLIRADLMRAISPNRP
ncbi:acyltransferase family protein [soil metagenome]